MPQPGPFTSQTIDGRSTRDLTLPDPPVSSASSRYRMTPWFLEHDDVPVITVSGETHYSRVPRDQWRDRLNLMKAVGSRW